MPLPSFIIHHFQTTRVQTNKNHPSTLGMSTSFSQRSAMWHTCYNALTPIFYQQLQLRCCCLSPKVCSTTSTLRSFIALSLREHLVTKIYLLKQKSALLLSHVMCTTEHISLFNFISPKPKLSLKWTIFMMKVIISATLLYEQK